MTAMTEREMATVSDGDIEFNWTVPGRLDRVWKAITDPDAVSRWLSCPVTLEPRVGGRVAFDWDDEAGSAKGTVTRFEQPDALGYTWGGSHWREESQVLWQLEAGDDGEVVLRLDHSGLTGPEAEVRELAAGWHDFLNALLEELGEKRPPESHEDLVSQYRDAG
jgi:uncharacterized protein YndB with AHSA1/START domain